jgi:hypothetical protein
MSEVQMQYSFSKFFPGRCSLVIISSKGGRKKRVCRQFCEWLSASVAYLRLLCQPAVARGFIYADLRSELNTHLAPQTLFTQSSPGHDAIATSFPLCKHTGRGDTALAFLGLYVYLLFTWEVDLPPSPVEFSSHCHFYKLSHS